MSVFSKWSVTPEQEDKIRNRHGMFKGRPRPGRAVDREVCVECSNPIDDDDLCVNKRCRRSKPEGQVGTGWGSHPNNEKAKGFFSW
jgi:hypothetical protein